MAASRSDIGVLACAEIVLFPERRTPITFGGVGSWLLLAVTYFQSFQDISLAPAQEPWPCRTDVLKRKVCNGGRKDLFVKSVTTG
jgi:hypothetical protein